MAEEKLDKVIEGIEFIQKTNDTLQEDMKGLKGDVLKIEAIEKASEDFTLKLQEMQDERVKESAQHNENLEKIQTEILRSNSNSKTEKNEYEHSYSRYLKKGVAIPDEELEVSAKELITKSTYGLDDNQISMLTKDLVSGSDPDGGLFISPDRTSRMSTRFFETSPIMQLASVETTSSNEWTMLLDDTEPDAGWVGEVSARPDTASAGIAEIKIPVHEIYAQPRATQRMLDDAGFDIAGWHERKVSSKISRLVNTSAVVGDGSQKLKGFLSYPAWAVADTYERFAVEQRTTTGASGALDDADDIIKLQYDLLEDYQMNATWGMDRRTFAIIAQLKSATTGEYLLNPRMLREGAAPILLGKPVVFMSDMPAVTNSALSIVYADFRDFYTVVDRFGIRVLRDPYTSKPYIRFYTTKRIGGAVTNYEAGKILKIKA